MKRLGLLIVMAWGMILFGMEPVPLEKSDLLADFVMIEPSTEMQRSWYGEAVEEKNIADATLEEIMVSKQEVTWWQAFKNKLGAIPQGVGYLGQVLRTLSESRWYLESSLSVILLQEEQKLPASDKKVLEAVRKRVKDTIASYEIRSRDVAQIDDVQRRTIELSILNDEFLRDVHFITRLDQPQEGLGAVSFRGHLILLLTYLKDIRIVEQSQAQVTEIFTTWASFVTNFIAELLNTQKVVVNGQVQDRNPYRNTDALVHVHERGTIAPEERERFLPARRKKNIEAQQNLFATFIAQPNINVAPVTEQTGLKIGLLMSGGGYRAMVLASGYLEALEQLGILDASSHIATLSGSTWFLSAWIQSGLSVHDFNVDLQNRIPYMQVDYLARIALQDPTRKEALHYDIMFPKFAFRQPIGSVDMFGWLLSQAVLQGDYTSGISNQWDKVKEGRYPFPCYTTISMHNTGTEEQPRYRYNWYEVNPLEFENIELGLSIPIWGLGREYSNGRSVRTKGLPTYPFEQSLGYELATFGSAYTINFLKEGSQFVEGVYGTLLNAMQKIKTIKRLWPAQSNNPWKDLAGQPVWVQQKPLLTFVDAGIDFNLPVPPLLKKERDLDVIIIGDSSSGIENMIQINGHEYPAEFAKFLLYAHDIKFDAKITAYQIPNILYEPYETYAKAPFIVFKPKERKVVPWLIYFNYVSDGALIANALRSPDMRLSYLANKIHHFDPVQCEKTGFCGTFNFKYSAEQFEQLKSMGQFNVLAHSEKLMKVLEREFVLKSHFAECPGCLVMGAYKNNKQVVDMYQKRNVSINTRTRGVPGAFINDEITALHAAVLQGNQDMVHYLTALNADINARSLYGVTPLDIAVMNRNRDIVRFLLQHEAQIVPETLLRAEQSPEIKGMLEEKMGQEALPEALGHLQQRLQGLQNVIQQPVRRFPAPMSIVKQKD